MFYYRYNPDQRLRTLKRRALDSKTFEDCFRYAGELERRIGSIEPKIDHTFVVYDIVYDFDDPDMNPRCEPQVLVFYSNTLNPEELVDEPEELAEAVSNITGYSVRGFSYAVTTPYEI